MPFFSWLSFFWGYKAFKSWYRSGFPCTDLFYLDVALVAVGVIVVDMEILSPDFLSSEYRLSELVSKLGPAVLFNSSFFSGRGAWIFSFRLIGSWSRRSWALLWTISSDKSVEIVGRFLKSFIKQEWTISPSYLEYTRGSDSYLPLIIFSKRAA